MAHSSTPRGRRTARAGRATIEDTANQPPFDPTAPLPPPALPPGEAPPTSIPLSIGLLPPGEGQTYSGPLALGGLRRHTGRQLVRYTPGHATASTQLLQSRLGLRIHAADAGAIAQASALTLPAEEGIMFERLGVMMVNSTPDKAGSLSALALEDNALSSTEWERFVYASTVDASYLRGYRAGVDRLIDDLLNGGAPASLSSPAGPDDATFKDDGAVTWGLRAVGGESTRLTGKSIRIAVLDTGVDLRHPDLQGRVAASQSFVDGQPVQDRHGHGTHCAGIICGPPTPQRLPRYGIAPEAQLYVGKVLGNDGVGTDTSILGGISWALDQKCSVISMSLGTPTELGTPWSRAFEQVGAQVLAAGSVIVAAAGNDSRRPSVLKPVSHPANCPSFMAVAALDRRVNVAWFSNAGLDPNGGQVDIAGPGVDVLSAWPMPTGYKLESGTSMATPHVAAIVALLAQANPSARGRELMNLACQHARRLQLTSIDVGAGLAQSP